MAPSSCVTARRTSSSRAERTSRPSRWSRPWPGTRPCWSAPSSPSRTPDGANGPRHSSRSSPATRSAPRRSLPSAASTWRTSNARRRSSSASCPRRPPARCAKLPYVTGRGPGTPSGFTELTVGNRAVEMLQAVLGVPEAPVGTTPKEVVWRKNKARLYRYTRAAPPTRRTPVFLVMPLVNRAYILDLRPGASLVEFLLQQGFNVFLLDWGIPSDEDRDLSLDSMLTGYLARAVRRASELAGSVPLTLLGYSTGGTLAACFTALNPGGLVKNLVLFTTPIDFSDSGQLGRWSQTSAFPVEKLTEVFPTVPPYF